MKKIALFVLLFLSYYSFAQIRGSVVDSHGNPMAFVNIYVQDTYISTTTNEQGKYDLNVKNPGKYIILFQYLGYKTEKKVIDAEKFPQIVDVVLVEEEVKLNEVVIDPKVNPANEMIRNAIANRKINANKTARYNADFYSKGIFRVKNLPKNILGQKLDLFDDVIDSTRSGILYLSETVSKISFQKPDKMKETIVASKVSGNDNGFSFNNAASANFDFYENTVEFNEKAISPIADNAFNYYKYKFEGSFTDENNQLINKIKVTPKRANEPVMEGHIYLVDDSWAIYAIDLTITGVQMQTPALNTLTLKQNFSYNNRNKIWIKNTQTIDFEAGILTLKMNGRFTYVFSNFEFPEKFEKKTFGAEVLKFEENANKKEDAFWNTIRPVPLTTEETNDYLKKDALQTKKKSKVYLDSIDAKKNKFRFMSPISGYTYSNTFKKWTFNYDGPLLNTSFNTVQGWNTSVGFSYGTNDEDKRTYSRISTRLSYGFAEDKFRATASYIRKFNNNDNSTLYINGGSLVSQFNGNNPISKNVNTISSLLFVNNFMKLYEKNYATISFGKEVINGVNMNASIEYAERKPLWNTTEQRWIKSEDDYTSNHPLLPFDFETPAIEKHNLVKASLSAQIKFGQEYWTRPDGKFNLGNNKYPILFFAYEKGFAANNKNYEFDFVSARVSHNLSIGNKGEMQMNLKGGKFFNGDNISFVDYKHFNGNQTHIANGGSYLNVFNNLPYYSMSTNDSYFETHIEHNDKGYIMNKIPLLNKLQSQLVLGFHNLAIPNQKPYQEFTIGLDNLGFGKLRLFRFDYVRSYQNGYQGDAIVFGLKFLNLIE
ncbi:MAG: carboxypeptidase-like regulatory domain-containing protein [Flavobacterium sp.]|nr:carboxypeptidase-like regulatory domain-containing protein [Flavobacterium sp.]